MANKTRPGENQRRGDLQDPPRDEERLKSEEATLDLPDVKDIPGQEHVHAPRMNAFIDTTISSDDEEGKRVWESDETSTVSDLEKKLLDDSANDMPTNDELQLRRAELDTVDDDGDPLNEKSTANAISGSDLDIPGAESDDDSEEIGEEDEENNSYSLGGDDQSINEERSGT